MINLGEKMEDGSYYMGVSGTTGTDFFLFIGSIGTNKHVDSVTFTEANQILTQKQEEEANFHGHPFSEQQLEHDIVAAYEKGKADGGVRRLTKDEWQQIEGVFTKQTDLKQMVLDICGENSSVLTASAVYNREAHGAWFHRLEDGSQDLGYAQFDDGCLLLGRSLTHSPKP